MAARCNHLGSGRQGGMCISWKPSPASGSTHLKREAYGVLSKKYCGAALSQTPTSPCAPWALCIDLGNLDMDADRITKTQILEVDENDANSTSAWVENGRRGVEPKARA